MREHTAYLPIITMYLYFQQPQNYGNIKRNISL